MTNVAAKATDIVHACVVTSYEISNVLLAQTHTMMMKRLLSCIALHSRFTIGNCVSTYIKVDVFDVLFTCHHYSSS